VAYSSIFLDPKGMAIFVDLDEEAEPHRTQPYHGDWNGERAKLRLQQELLAGMNGKLIAPDGLVVDSCDGEPVAANKLKRESSNRNRMTEALRCYPYV
jgi:hypothetical protein